MTSDPVIAVTRSLPARSNSDSVPQDVGQHWTLLLLSAGVLLTATILQLHSTTGIRLPGWQTPLPEICMTHRLFQVPCPGCGLTRSTLAMVRGDLPAALEFNPAGPFVFALIASQVPLRLYALWRIRRGLRVVPFPGGFAALGLVVLLAIVQWLVKLGGLLT